MSGLDVTVGEGVLTLTIDRQEARNALSLEMVHDLTARLGDLGDARCVVLRANGPVFCAGADLRMLAELGSPEKVAEIRTHVYGGFQALIAAVVDAPVPVIAALQGPALGAGADLALACDMRVAADTAYLEETWIRLGVISALGATSVLPDTLGVGTALDLFLTGRRLEADEALRRGVVQRVVPAVDLDACAADMATAVAGQDPAAVAAFRRLVRGAGHRDRLQAALDAALTEQVDLIARPEFAVRVARILEATSGGIPHPTLTD